MNNLMYQIACQFIFLTNNIYFIEFLELNFIVAFCTSSLTLKLTFAELKSVVDGQASSATSV
jgi:hypothetical protein